MPAAERLAACRLLPKNGLYSLLFNTLIAALLSAVGFGGDFITNFVYSQCIGLPAWFLIDGSYHLLWPKQSPPVLPMVSIVIAGMVAATYGGTWFAASFFGHPWNLKTPFTSLLIAATAGFIVVLFFWERGRTEKIERQVAEARLKLLQAQIEPHFLFNTLANLDALIAADAPRARKMLAHLNDYLRATLATARKERNTLAGEFALLNGYLEILAIRMGPRLAFSLELPEPLRGREIPPMLLQPLIENAVKHGLDPKLDGGFVRIAASVGRAGVRIDVEDNGQPGPQTSGTGVGLAQVRERLAALYGERASLEIAARAGGGTIATLTLPE